MFNTCAVRENADNKLYGNLGRLRPVKDRFPGMQIAVGGCLAQKDRSTIVDKAPWVDVVFGTHNIGSPAGPARPGPRTTGAPRSRSSRASDVFPSTLPTRRDSAYAGWVSISVGCNNTCTFCIVPSLRGKEQDRRPGDILAEVEALVAQGVVEVTLLGQNVNTYGVEFGDRLAFGKLLRACGEIEGLERVRFTSPHPAAFTDDVIAAMAETPNVMPSLHMPLQSGSDRVLKAMRRSYRSARFLGILDKVRAQIPDAAITTDLIVGFPGETEEDFEQTLEVVRASRFASAFTFQYSIRPGTPAATMDDQVPKAVVQERYERLLAVQEEVSWAENRRLEGRTVEVLVAQGEGRKDAATARLSGRARDNRLVHFAVPEGAAVPRPGDVVEVARHLRRAAPPRRRLRPRRAGSTPCAAPAAATPGRPCRTRRSPGDPRSPSACRRRAAGPGAHDAARLRLTGDDAAAAAFVPSPPAFVPAAHGPGGPRAGRPARRRPTRRWPRWSTRCCAPTGGAAASRRAGARREHGAGAAARRRRAGCSPRARAAGPVGFGEFGLEVDLPALPGASAGDAPGPCRRPSSSGATSPAGSPGRAAAVDRLWTAARWVTTDAASGAALGAELRPRRSRRGCC